MRARAAYLISGNAHMPYIVCSIWTLRQHWDGEIVICAWPDSFGLAKQVAEDSRLRITDVRPRHPQVVERNASCVNHSLDKIKMIQSMAGETDVVMYIDGDTTIHNPITPLLEMGLKYGFVATQFCDWVTTGKKIGRRIKKLREFPEIDQGALDFLASNPIPSINSGIFAACPESPVFDLYYYWTHVARKVFIADEIVLHAVFPVFQPLGQMVIATDDGKWNCSPKFQSKNLADESVVVRHFHGDSNVRPEKKSQRGFDLWWPIYQECLEKNVGGMADWKDQIQTKYLHRLEADLASKDLAD